MENLSKRVGIYARVSTTDKGQDLNSQLFPLREYCKMRGWEIYQEYLDQMSGAKESRPGFDELMSDAHKRKFDIVLVFRFDRCSRSSKQLILTLDTLRNLGIDFVSYNENIDTTSPAGQMMFTIISAFSQFERSIIQERVKAGIQRAKKEGKSIGRPTIDVDNQEVYKLKNQGMSIRNIAKTLKINRGKVERILKVVS